MLGIACDSLLPASSLRSPQRTSPPAGISEIQLQSKLQLSLRCDGRSDDSGRARAIIDEIVRLCEDRMVESVKHLKAELQVLALRDVKDFAERYIAGYGARTLQAVLCGITEGKVCGQRVAVDVEPVVYAALAAGKVAVTGLVGAVQAVRAGVGGIEAHLRCEVETGVKGDNSAHVPATQDQIGGTA